ncbi:MAG: energy transducer TonB [Neptuniibacter caesariensis]|uniref:Energy transducer TonB n=1 Tax=Neptuniibacter caesariensis TaxID=207954 RepID=A0A2G6JBR2_NEPCE|nr:MAG: energy transducer TonB [Neptuniibacter caesariensis]
MSTTATPAVSAIERFGFTLFFATALHAIAIIGISFTPDIIKPPLKTLEITLAQFQQDKAPKEADFIAQANQAGSGDAQEKLLPSTPQNSSLRDEKVNPHLPQQSTAKPKIEQTTAQVTTRQAHKPVTKPDTTTHNTETKKVIATVQPKEKKATVSNKAKTRTQPQQQAANRPQTSLLARSLEIASLQAEIDSQRELRAKQPRIKRLTSASTQKREDALYLANWRKKIEQVGNLNYPEEARRKKVYGSLRLLVSINPDGSVKNIELLKSSGKPLLDDAAKRIVRLAAPFQPFPVEMRKNTDVLEIIRTWKFEKRAYIY